MTFPRTLLAACVALLLALPASAAERRPNVLILLADDYGYADCGCQGCTDIPTPNIDSLAKGGVRCTSGYVSGPYCSPTRAGLLTGCYQQRFGHEFNPGPAREGRKGDTAFGLPLDQTTIADRLRKAGYKTGLVGKWHLGEAPRFRPTERGFDEFFGFLGGAHPYFPGKGAPIFRGNQPVDEKEYLTDAFAREAVAFIDRHQREPFFLYLAFNAVHTPMDATDERLAKFRGLETKTRQTYAAMTLAMDEAIGRVLDKLRAAGLEDDTLIFFFSDNGGPTMRGTTINGSRNTPLRGSKRTTLEGGVRVPWIVQWKRRLPQGQTYEQPVIQLDILPTALAAAGVEPRADWQLDGVNLLPYLGGKNSGRPHDVLYWRLGEQMAIRRGDWKLVAYDTAADDGPGQTVTPRKLYNLARDVGESRDLSDSEKQQAGELAELWQAWSASLKRPLWGPGGGGKSP